MGDDRQDVWKKIKETREAVGWVFTGLDVIASAGTGAGIWNLSASAKQRYFIGAFVLLFSLFGYFASASIWKGKPRESRLRWGCLFFALFILFMLLTGWLIDALGPTLASRYSWIEDLREFLIRASLTGNLIVGMLSGFAAMFIVSSITVFSPELAYTASPNVKPGSEVGGISTGPGVAISVDCPTSDSQVGQTVEIGNLPGQAVSEVPTTASDISLQRRSAKHNRTNRGRNRKKGKGHR